MIRKITISIRISLFVGLSLSRASGDGLVRVKDIDPSFGSSSPCNFVRCGDFIYFAALTYASGRELWRTDGTEAGTTLVRDINPGRGHAFDSDSASYSFNVMGGNLYFKTQDNYLWRSDGTSAGTFQLNS